MKTVESNISKEEILDYGKRGDCYTWCFPINLEKMDIHHIWEKQQRIGLADSLSLYIHVPYCKFVCEMCPFTHEIIKEEEFDRYVRNLLEEIRLYSKHRICKSTNVSSIYFGGGTASMLRSEQVKEIIQVIRKEYHILENCEICLECHPNTVTKEYLARIKEAGVTRVSFGIQSFQQKNLKVLKLWQKEARNKEIIRTAMSIGFHTVAMDLMYNFPDETLEDLQQDLEYAVGVGVQGLSVYALDPEVRKLSSVKERQEKMQMEKRMFYQIREYLEKNGYLQTAQPDYALQGHENRQIIDLWGAPQKYNLGFGAGAFSENFNGCTWANIHDPQKYMECMENGLVPILMGKKWSIDDAMARYMALGVRMLNVPVKPFEEQFGLKIEDIFKYELQRLVDMDYVTTGNKEIQITEKGRFYIDNISKTFFNFSNRGRSQYWGCQLREYMPEYLYQWNDVLIDG